MAASLSPVLDTDRLALPDPTPAAPARRLGPAAVGLLAFLLGLVALAAWIGDLAVAGRRQALVEATQSRLQALAHGRAEVLATWLQGVEAQGRRLTRSELVQLFALELALSPPELPLPTELAEQRPYMRQLLDDMARQGELVGAYLVSADGRLLLADAAAPPIGGSRLAGAAAVAAGAAGAPRIAVPEPAGDRFMLDLQLPMPPPQPAFAPAAPRGAALVLRVDAGQRLEQLLAAGPLDLPGGAVDLRLADGTRVGSGEPTGLQLADGQAAAATALHAEAGVAGTGWAIEQSVAETAALAPLAEFRRSVTLGALAAALLLALAVGGGWWWLASRHQAELLAQYRDLAGRLRRQHDLLQGIMSAAPDMIALKSTAGAYVYANPALATALGLPPADLLGRGDAELFAADTAAALQRLDRDAATLGMARRDELEVMLAGRRRHLGIVAVPLAGEGAAAVGTVLLARDVTEQVAHRREREGWVEQTIGALARAIELADPYLCGHSQRLGRLAGAIALELGLDGRAVATVRAASALSQIGKLFVPRELLTKPGRHAPAEQEAMRRHVDHAQMVLREVDLGLPVAAVLGQMHERLDGTGYPHGLGAAAISLPARVLAVADVFCARTMPRGYRDAVAADEAIRHLRDHADRYDAAAVAALATVWSRDPQPLTAG